jgi:hypothetical protein
VFLKICHYFPGEEGPGKGGMGALTKKRGSSVRRIVKRGKTHYVSLYKRVVDYLGLRPGEAVLEKFS